MHSARFFPAKRLNIFLTQNQTLLKNSDFFPKDYFSAKRLFCFTFFMTPFKSANSSRQVWFSTYFCPLLNEGKFSRQKTFSSMFFATSRLLKGKLGCFQLDPTSVVKSTRALTIQKNLFQHFFALLVTCTLLARVNGFEPERKANENII